MKIQNNLKVHFCQPNGANNNRKKQLLVKAFKEKRNAAERWPLWGVCIKKYVKL